MPQDLICDSTCRNTILATSVTNMVINDLKHEVLPHALKHEVPPHALKHSETTGPTTRAYAQCETTRPHQKRKETLWMKRCAKSAKTKRNATDNYVDSYDAAWREKNDKWGLKCTTVHDQQNM